MCNPHQFFLLAVYSFRFSFLNITIKVVTGLCECGRKIKQKMQRTYCNNIKFHISTFYQISLNYSFLNTNQVLSANGRLSIHLWGHAERKIGYTDFNETWYLNFRSEYFKPSKYW